MSFYKSWRVRYLAWGRSFGLGLQPSEIEETVERLDTRVGELTTENERLREAQEHSIALSAAEIQSGLSRVRWAELLIRQLPESHEGRNSWLLNYATPRKYLRDDLSESPPDHASGPARRWLCPIAQANALTVEPPPQGPEDPVVAMTQRGDGLCYCGMPRVGHTQGVPLWCVQR